MPSANTCSNPGQFEVPQWHKDTYPEFNGMAPAQRT